MKVRADTLPVPQESPTQHNRQHTERGLQSARRAGSVWVRRNKFRAPPCSGRVSDALIGARTSVRPARWRHVDGGINSALRRAQRARQTRQSERGLQSARRGGGMWEGGMNSALLSRC